MSNNRLIVRNSVFMAVRMFVVMAIGLYSSRVVLQQLGVTDFGIFTVVGGLTIIMTFFTSALAAAIQRFMNVELSVSGQRSMQEVFSACWACIMLIVCVFLILAEGAGLWFLNDRLDIPPDRLPQARVLFQMSLAVAILEICRVPYNSLIIAHERMSFYAYNSIVEALLKLAAVILLPWIPGDKLLIYMALLIGVALLVNLSYVWFCRREFAGLRFSVRGSGGRVKEIGRFIGWNLLTSISDIAWQQGSAMVLNIFYGVALNATMGISNQVKTAVFSFSRSIQTAANPQIVKNYAAGRIGEFSALFMRISRISFLFVLLLGGPILMNTEFILDLWLTEIPPCGTTFVRLMILFCILDSLSGPLWITMQAYGNISRYQITVSAIWLLALPLMYLAFSLGGGPQWLLFVLIGIDAILLVVRVLFTGHCCGVSAFSYLRGVAVPLAASSGAAVAVTGAFLLLLGHTGVAASPWGHFLLTSAVWCLALPGSVYFLGLTPEERTALTDMRHKYLKF